MPVENYLDCVNWGRKTCSLWIESFLRQSALGYMGGKGEQVSKHIFITLCSLTVVVIWIAASSSCQFELYAMVNCTIMCQNKTSFSLKLLVSEDLVTAIGDKGVDMEVELGVLRDLLLSQLTWASLAPLLCPVVPILGYFCIFREDPFSVHMGLEELIPWPKRAGGAVHYFQKLPVNYPMFNHT